MWQSWSDPSSLFIDLSCSFLVCIASLIHLSTLLPSLSMTLAWSQSMTWLREMAWSVTADLFSSLASDLLVLRVYALTSRWETSCRCSWSRTPNARPVSPSGQITMGPEGAWPPWKTVWPPRNTWFERVQGGLVKFNTWLQHINIILSTDGDAQCLGTWLINHAQFCVRRNQRCCLRTIGVAYTLNSVFSSMQITQRVYSFTRYYKLTNRN